MFVFNLYTHVHCIPNNVRSFIYNQRIIKMSSRSTKDIVISGLWKFIVHTTNYDFHYKRDKYLPCVANLENVFSTVPRTTDPKLFVLLKSELDQL